MELGRSFHKVVIRSDSKHKKHKILYHAITNNIRYCDFDHLMITVKNKYKANEFASVYKGALTTLLFHESA